MGDGYNFSVDYYDLLDVILLLIIVMCIVLISVRGVDYFCAVESVAATKHVQRRIAGKYC